jgi:hypothetical protein
MDVARNVSVSMFETTIRVVGGLLAAYDLADDALLLARARALADKILINFRITGHGAPLGGPGSPHPNLIHACEPMRLSRGLPSPPAAAAPGAHSRRARARATKEDAEALTGSRIGGRESAC